MTEHRDGLVDALPFSTVEFSPSHIVRRRITDLGSIQADTIELTRREPFEYSVRSTKHLFIMSERSERDQGETVLEGVPKSTLREISGKLSFVPAGHRFYGWQEPRVLSRVTHFYIDPLAPLFGPESGVSLTVIRPRLFFFDQALWDTASKLKAQAESSAAGSREYADALGLVLLHELARSDGASATPNALARGGLAAWQQRRVAGYIDEHLAEEIPLSDLAGLAQLSPFHFSRAFKQSLGLPPHRYHIARRVDRAKHLLSDPDLSVTQIAVELGFHETSSFTATFRKFVGRTPTDFRRALL